MSLSTTSTATYTLAKYSRAYPSKTSPSEAEVEWQHFTNPVMQLVLDIKKKTSGEPESYRVRVLWFLNQGVSVDAMDVDQREVVFEDVDLLSFSPPTSQYSQTQSFSAHGLPLKAVYKDAVVGIRYMHPRTINNESTPSYRRFQVNFQNVPDATNFIDAIRHVCPCKTNGPSLGLSARSTTIASSRGSSSGSATKMKPPEAPPTIPAKRMRTSATMQCETFACPSNRASGVAVSLGPHIQLGKVSDTEAPSLASVSSIPPPQKEIIGAQNTFEPSRLYYDGQHETALDVPAVSLSRSDVQALSSSTDYDQISNTNTSSIEGYDGNRLTASYLSSSSAAPNVLPPLQRHSESSSLAMSSVLSGQSMVSDIASTSGTASDLQSTIQQSSASHSSYPPIPAFDSFMSSSGLDVTSDLRLSAQQSEPQSATQQGFVATPLPVHMPLDSASLSMVGSTKDGLLSALRQDSSLYKLPPEELESLVGSILREDGFIDLLKTLDKMWRVKGFVKSVV